MSRLTRRAPDGRSVVPSISNERAPSSGTKVGTFVGVCQGLGSFQTFIFSTRATTWAPISGSTGPREASTTKLQLPRLRVIGRSGLQCGKDPVSWQPGDPGNVVEMARMAAGTTLLPLSCAAIATFLCKAHIGNLLFFSLFLYRESRV
jgi:hypothetical protein